MNGRHNWKILVCTVSFFLGACGDNNSGSDARTLFEENFVSDTRLRANPEDQTVITGLEHSASDKNQTGEAGTDHIPYYHAESRTHRYCFGEHDESSHRFAVVNAEGAELLSIVSGEPCASVYIPKGDYEYVLTHDGQSDRMFPVFIRPRQMLDDQLANPVTLASFAQKMLAVIGSYVISEAVADDQNPSIETFISTNSCTGCDFTNAVFPDDKEFDNVDFTGADFSKATMDSVSFQDSNFSGATFDNTSGEWAEISDSNFTNSRMVNSDMGAAVLAGNNFSGATLKNNSLVYGIFEESNFEGAVLDSNDFSAAIMDGVIFDDAFLNNNNFQYADFCGVELSWDSDSTQDVSDADFSCSSL